MGLKLYLFLFIPILLGGCHSIKFEKRHYSNGYYLSLNKLSGPDKSNHASNETKDSLGEIASLDAASIHIQQEEPKLQLIQINSPSVRSKEKESQYSRSIKAETNQSKKSKSAVFKKKKFRDEPPEDFPEELVTWIILGVLLLGLITLMLLVPLTQSWLIILGILIFIIVLAAILMFTGIAGPDILLPALGGGGGALIGIINFLYYIGLFI